MEVDIDGSRFAERTRSFVEWFQALPGATFRSDLIAVEDLRAQNAGRGIVALADVEPDTVLFTIPRNAIICAATSQLRDKIPHVFGLDNDDAGQPDSGDDDDDGSGAQQDSWTLLILAMLYEYLQGESSRWKPYLDVLPTVFDTPMFWSPAELSEFQASALVAKVGKDEADRMIKTKIIPVVRAHEQVFFPPGSSSQTLDDAQLLALAHRMGSTIMAYAFDLESDDPEIKQADEEADDEWVEDREGKTMLGMVPMADILNADAEFNAHINHGEDALTATALRRIKAGEEIFNYYGPLPNGELLRRYGYVTPHHSRYDVVELPWDLVEAELRQRAAGGSVAPSDWEKARKLTLADDAFEESFVLERASDDPDSEGRLGTDTVFAGLPDELGEQFKAFLKSIKKVCNANLAVLALSDGDMRKNLYLQAVLGALQARERQYATSLEEDEHIIRAGQLTRRQQMAVWVRRGEKQVLREAQAWVRRQMDELRNNLASEKRAQGDDGPTAKRRRV
ncbi:SET domain-containing protein [Parathielavia appendiculata]|uniref:SET domain-containing protein n=1 Tax=Parathielavia appendiculata TaxID=2587402 RepID=A0AAN6Z132_9PEZI|nr:SET domain-containing protein [Parathielavia appendiculata]